MNSFMKIGNLEIDLGTVNIDVPFVITHNKPYDNIEISVNKKYFTMKDNLPQCHVICDIRISYGTIESLLGLHKRDLYYIYTPLQTISRKEIELGLANSHVIKKMIVGGI